MVTFLRNHLNFQNSFVSNKHQYDFCFCTKLWIPKNPCVRSCIVLEERGNIPKYSWCNGFMLKGYVQCVICMKQQQKWRHVMNTEKHMILLTRKAHLTRKVLWNCEPNYQQKLEQVETKIKKFCRHDQTEVVFFFGRTRIGFIMHRWCNSPSVSLPTKKFAETLDCVEAYWPMFASNFFRLSRCWVLNKDERSVGRNFHRVIFQYLLE